MMPSLRKKVAGFIRHLSVNNQAETVTDENSSSSGCFIHRYLNGDEVGTEEPVILHGRSPQELPHKTLGPYLVGSDTILAAVTGPDDGLTTVNKKQRHLSTSDPDVDYIDILDSQHAEHHDRATENSSRAAAREEIAGVYDWKQSHLNACGAATTLYEKQPLTQEHAGNPIADCFGLVARRDSAVLVLADGVNWGEKACVAARSAVHGCVEHLNKALFTAAAPRITNTLEVFIALLRSFHAAHSMILQEDGMLTTLTTAVVLPLLADGKYVVCVCNVGDSLAYVYSEKYGVREVTKGSHDIHCMRDMRDALGALGPVDGQNPELNNLTCSMTEIDASDIVFVTSDGVSDNFDPVVGKFAVVPQCGSPGDARTPTYGAFDAARTNVNPFAANRTANSGGGRGRSNGNKARSNINKAGGKVNAQDFSFTSTLPTVQAYQRHELSLLRMDDLLKNGVSGLGPPCSTARSLCDLLLDFATRLTAAKRHILEDTDLYYEPCAESVSGLKELGKPEQRARRKKVLDKLAMVPGKLDHATVVAYKVGLGLDADLRETDL